MVSFPLLSQIVWEENTVDFTVLYWFLWLLLIVVYI